MQVEGFGITMTAPQGWDAKLYQREDPPEGTEAMPVLHAANFPLPPEDGDYPTLATESMGPGDILVALLEFRPDQYLTVGEGLFEPKGFPSEIRLQDYEPTCMPQQIPGVAGLQRFFSLEERAFCLYSLLGGYPELLEEQQLGRLPQIDLVREIVASFKISTPSPVYRGDT